jgi:hypothetical protein
VAAEQRFEPTFHKFKVRCVMPCSVFVLKLYAVVVPSVVCLSCPDLHTDSGSCPALSCRFSRLSARNAVSWSFFPPLTHMRQGSECRGVRLVPSADLLAGRGGDGLRLFDLAVLTLHHLGRSLLREASAIGQVAHSSGQHSAV